MKLETNHLNIRRCADGQLSIGVKTPSYRNNTDLVTHAVLISKEEVADLRRFLEDSRS